MIRTNSFSIKILISLTLFSFSLFFFYISYQEFSKYYQEDLVLFEDVNINYFDKEIFQKYYEKIDIENLSDPQFNEEKSKNYFKDIAFDNLSQVIEDNTIESSNIFNCYEDGNRVSNRAHLVNFRVFKSLEEVKQSFYWNFIKLGVLEMSSRNGEEEV